MVSLSVAKYEDPRAHAVRERYVNVFGGDELPVPVERIAEDLLGLRIVESDDLNVSGILLPAERRIVLNAAEAEHGGAPIQRHRFTIAHEVGHWVCHVLGATSGSSPAASYCRAADLAADTDRLMEREANVFAAELLMPEAAVREVWGERGEIEAVAERFAVSRLAAHWRLYAYGLLAERPM